MKTEIKFILPSLFTFLLILIAGQISAQAIVQEGIKKMSAGDKNCFYVELPTTDEKLAAKVWTDFMKDYKAKTKRNKKTKEYFSDNASISGMSDNTVDVFARFSGNELTVWFDLGGAYLSSYQHAGQYPAVEKMLNAYELELSKELAKAGADAKAKELKKLEKELKKLEKENKRYEDTIKKAEKTIQKAEKGKEENLKLQEKKREAIKAKEAETQDAKNELKSLKKQK